MDVHVRWVIVLLLCCAGAMGSRATAAPATQQQTRLTMVVRQFDAVPQAGVRIRLVLPDGQEQVAITNAEGMVVVDLLGSSVWIRGAELMDGSPLTMVDRNTPEGGLRIPLEGRPLVLAFALEDRALLRVPSTLDNPAFPEPIWGDPPAAGATVVVPGPMPSAPDASASVAPAPRTPTPDQAAPAPQGWPLWVWMLLLVVAAVAVPVVIYVRTVVAYQTTRRRGR